MKKLCLLLIVCANQFMFSQDFTPEKSFFSGQIGLFGMYVNHELRLSNQFVLKSEVGLDFFSTDNNDLDFKALAPVITLEPRWYYNLNKRGNAGKNVTHNGGNFVSITSSYHPDWFVITNAEGPNFVIHQLAIVPKWGIKRNFGTSNFNYEVGAGLGYNIRFLKHYGFAENDGQVYIDLHARIGYSF